MDQVVYLDVFFVWNFVMDAVSLLLAGWIASERASLLRLALASAFGGVSAVGILLLNGGRFATLLLGFLSFIPMIGLAFGRRSFRRLAFISLFAFISALFLGGALESLSYYAGREEEGITLLLFLEALFLALGAFQLWGKHLKRKMESRVISLSILHRDRQAQFYALVDSGAFLREPISGSPVILLKAEYAEDLLSPEELLSLRLGEGEGVIPIPVKTASGGGCLFAFSPGAVKLHCSGRRGKKTKEEKVLVALDFTGGGFAGCPCLVPLSVV